MQIQDSDLITARGKVIEVGRVKIPRCFDFDYEIPLLSFVVIEKAQGEYVVTCINLLIDGHGNTSENAISDMIRNVGYFLYENFNNESLKDSAWYSIYNLFKSSPTSNKLWDVYYAFQIMLAERNVTTDGYLHNKAKMLTSLEDKVEKAKSDVGKSNEKELKNNWWRNFWGFSKSGKENNILEHNNIIQLTQNIKLEDMVVERVIKVA